MKKYNFLKNIKKDFYIFKYFLSEEKRLIFILIIAILAVSIYIFTNRLPEVMNYGGELMRAMYEISIALLVGVIFYFFQVFLPKIDKRINAQRELNTIINDLTGLISMIVENYYNEKEIWEIKFHNNPSQYIYDNIDLLSKYFESNLKLDDAMKFKWNKNKKTFRDEFFKRIGSFNNNYRELKLQYSDVLEKKTLDNLEAIYKNYIFIEIREHEYLSQKTDINKFNFKKLLENMRNVQNTANKINMLAKF